MGKRKTTSKRARIAVGRSPRDMASPLQRILNRERGRVVEDKDGVARYEEPAAPLVNEHAAANGNYVAIAEYGEARKARVNLRESPVTEWFAIGGTGFEAPQERAMEYVLGLWHQAATPARLVANYGHVSRGGVEGRTHFEAIDELGRWKDTFLIYWDVFENVVRYGEPAGFAGSRLSTNRPQSVASAKAVVGLILSVIATKRRL